MRGGALIVVLLGVLAVVAVGAFTLWDSLAGVALGWRGYLALVLGVGFSLLVGVGLMALVFVSARRGYDREAGGDAAATSDEGERTSKEKE